VILLIISVILCSILAVLALVAAAWPISIWAVNRFARRLIGLKLDAARAILKKPQLTEESWGDGKYSGQSLIAKYRYYQLRLMFGPDQRVIAVSVEILVSLGA
jgi:hypothetical protein